MVLNRPLFPKRYGRRNMINRTWGQNKQLKLRTMVLEVGKSQYRWVKVKHIPATVHNRTYSLKICFSFRTAMVLVMRAEIVVTYLLKGVTQVGTIKRWEWVSQIILLIVHPSQTLTKIKTPHLLSITSKIPLQLPENRILSRWVVIETMLTFLNQNQPKLTLLTI